MILRRWISNFWPSPAPLILAWVGLFFSATTALVACLVALDQSDPGTAGVLIAAVSLPIAVGMLAWAALIEPRRGPRFGLWAASNPLLGASCIFLPLFSVLRNESASPAGALGVLLTCCAPFWLIHTGVGILFGWKAWPEWNRILRAARHRRVIEIVEARGEATLGEIASEVSLPPERLIPILKELIASGELMASFDSADQRVYSLACLAEKQRRLLAVIHARGQLRLDELAAELRASREITRQWVVHLAQRGQLHAYADWERGWLHSPDAQALARQNAGRCPQCGGELGLAGKGVILCAHCGVEIFL